MAIGDLDKLSPTKRALLEKQLRGELPTHHPQLQSLSRRVSGDGAAPASYGQRQLWFLSRLAAGSVVYNEAATIHCPPGIHVPSLERAFNEVLRRHEAWRTRLEGRGDDLVQVVTPPRDHPLPFVDLTQLEAGDRRATADRLATEDAQRPFDEEHEPLWRAKVMNLGDEGCRLHLTLRHQIFDAYSLYRILLPELIALHDAFRRGRPSPLPELPVQYGDYAAWQRRWVEGDEAARQLDYWRGHLRALPQLRMPTDRRRPAVQSFRGRFLPFELDRDLTRRLRGIGQSQGATLFMAALAGFMGLLHCMTGQDDLALGTLSSGRRRTEVEGLLGYFPNPLVLRGDLSGDPSVGELLSRVRDLVLSALANDEIPFESVVRELSPERVSGANPLFQVLFTLEPPLPDPPDGWDLTLMDVETGTSKFDLSVELEERAQGVIGRFIYNTDLFDVETIRRMASDYRSVLEAIVAEPDRRLSSLRQMFSGGAAPPAVKTPRWAARQGPTVEIPQVGIGRRFEEMVQQFPHKEAVRFGDQRLSYAELDRRANRLAGHLRASGVGPGLLVGVWMERSLEMLVAVLATMKSGGALLPLDPGFPADRIRFMISDSKTKVVVTRSGLLAGAELAGKVDYVCVDRDAERIGRQSPSELDVVVAGDDLAYVIYTSGSTGRPKGVQVEHRNLANFVQAMVERPGVTSSDVLLAVTTLSFDISLLELLVPLVVGAQVVIVDSETATDGAALAALLAESGATIMQSTPSRWWLLIEARWRGDRRLKALCGGEAMTRDLADQLLARCGSVWNMYGPTETTIWSAVEEVRSGEGPVPIGAPVDNNRLYVLDANLQLQPIGVPGELVIGGSGVARGYLGRPELTAERFIPDPFRSEPGARMYRTGDLVRRTRIGDLEFLGRIDQQVKVRGYRIEPGEIESVLARHPAIAQAVVTAYQHAPGDTRLAAYYTLTDPRTSTGAEELRSHLRATLPDYMVPTAYMALDAFPSTPNNKIDRARLPAPDRTPAGAGDPPRPGLEMELARVWEGVLGTPGIGRDDDFFDLGGHSLLAVRMIAEVEQRFGCALPLAVVFGAGSTVSGLADLVEQAAQIAPPPSSRLMVTIKSSGRRPPVFVVEPNQAPVLSLRHFMPYLDAEQPLIALIAPNQDGRFDRDAGIEKLADELLELIRSRQPRGPYRLAGYSFGGVLTYELATRLSEAGERVDLFVLIDTLSPAMTPRYSWSWRSIRLRLRRLRASPLSRWPRALSAQGRRSIRGFDGGFDIEGAAQLACEYRIRRCSVPLTVFRSQWARRWTRDDSIGWCNVHAGPVQVQALPGDHRTILVQPTVNDLAARFAHLIPGSEQESRVLDPGHLTLSAASHEGHRRYAGK